ncbi:MAG: bifunctional DNA-formamidopyrimidine glycosylase/DNA-(apurinic or apyrimidinic site) lyase [Nevskia sp.]|nr:bifunctional DNA-formamidopyrimidine glycosylase/DNA-(apurinic or apyrimidinic site) lyase [Nevskia sp.]
MPELPEVETIRRGIEPHVVGHTIESATVRDPRLRWPVPAAFAEFVRGKRIRAVHRRGKYLVFDLGGDRLIVHLGMSGRLFLLDPDVPVKRHDHVDLLLSGRLLLRFHDPRRFGAVLPWPEGQAHHVLLAEMGPEPFAEEFNAAYLHALSRGRSAPVKNFIMDGRVVVGVGNIYASEALFRAGIRPLTAAGRVTLPRYARLVQAIRQVLNLALEHGGTTLRDYRGSDGTSGYFQQELMVYGRDGQPCRVCGAAVKRVVIGQRSSFFCTRCQR